MIDIEIAPFRAKSYYPEVNIEEAELLLVRKTLLYIV